MSLAVDNPILNNPFEAPREYWIYEEGQQKDGLGQSIITVDSADGNCWSAKNLGM